MEEEKRCTFWIKVSPRALHSRCLGWEENFLKIKLQAIPAKGNANKALILFLATIIKIAASAITLEKGHTSKIKQVSIKGFSLEKLKEKINLLIQIEK